MIDEDRTTWTLGQLADEVIEACEISGCRATIIAALGDAKDQGRAEGARDNAALREALRAISGVDGSECAAPRVVAAKALSQSHSPVQPEERCPKCSHDFALCRCYDGEALMEGKENG